MSTLRGAVLATVNCDIVTTSADLSCTLGGRTTTTEMAACRGAGARLLVTSHTTRRAPAPAPASRSTDTVWNVRVPGILAVLLVVADRISSPLACFQTIWTTIASEI